MFNETSDFNKVISSFDEDYKQEMAPTMIRQKHKIQLIKGSNCQLELLYKDKVLWGKKFNKAVKDIYKDLFKGIKQINKKNPVFVEMPKLVPVGKDTGQIKKVPDGMSKDEVTEIEIPQNLQLPEGDLE